MSEEELELRFYHATHVDSGIMDPIILISTGELTRLMNGLAAYEKSGARNNSLNEYLAKWLEGDKIEPVIPDVERDLNLDFHQNSENLNFDTEVNVNETAYTAVRRSVQGILISNMRFAPPSCQRIF